MPIEVDIPLRSISQSEFGEAAYEVVGHAFSIHQRLGNMFNESVYRRTLKQILAGRANEEVGICLTHPGFKKRFSIDLIVDAACPFELKVASDIHDRHRAQLIQYLMLTGLCHGKLINFGSEDVQHEFVNCHESREQRQSFRFDLRYWSNETPSMQRVRTVLDELLRDWGTGLSHDLYEEAVTHILSGSAGHRVDTLWSGEMVGQQFANIVDSRAAFKVTCKRSNLERYESHLRRFLGHTDLDHVYWANIVSGKVILTLLTK